MTSKTEMSNRNGYFESVLAVSFSSLYNCNELNLVIVIYYNVLNIFTISDILNWFEELNKFFLYRFLIWLPQLVPNLSVSASLRKSKRSSILLTNQDVVPRWRLITAQIPAHKHISWRVRDLFEALLRSQESSELDKSLTCRSYTS
jgi:hypothetical protein